MSSILKALKKLEQEKNIRRQEVMEIDTRILLDDRPGHSTARVALFCLILFACGGISAYWLLIKRTSQPQSAPPPAVHAPAMPVAIPAAAMPVTTAGRQAIPAPARAGTTTPNPRQEIAVPAGPSAPQPVPMHPEGPSEPAQRAATVPAVRVTGIAYQPDGMESVAMVNGIQVMAGSAVDGAKVDEILKDRVRFSCDGTKFEVLLGRSNR